ncbi:hypothetical protein PGO_134540 [Plasmodium gonderi]|uniref:Uncharacterized protein n=1 Tax=Plasmodium gonderi TaxID=77519 RepID=A0A1Y1JQR3_PLAGO|nr:hypothetical protein PGO_134540 [Plasmodium gonderi]GAW83182.1 hypothetical protein PGO_134540 [Plasmodium gonderi]
MRKTLMSKVPFFFSVCTFFIPLYKTIKGTQSYDINKVSSYDYEILNKNQTFLWNGENEKIHEFLGYELNNVCSCLVGDCNSSSLLYTSDKTRKQINKGDIYKFEELCFLLRSSIPFKITQKSGIKQKGNKNYITVRESIKNKSNSVNFVEEKIKKNVAPSYPWYAEKNKNHFAYQEEIKKIQSWTRKSRILVEACTLNCGSGGVCEMEGGMQYCKCNVGYSMDINDNLMCKKHCEVNNGGCDPNAECIPVSPENEVEQGVIKNVGVLCKCKNGNGRFMGYYCSSGYFTYFSFLLLLPFLLYWY